MVKEDESHDDEGQSDETGVKAHSDFDKLAQLFRTNGIIYGDIFELPPEHTKRKGVYAKKPFGFVG